MADTNERPDGRAAAPELLRLRAATRGLRLHLDELPIDYTLDTSADRFLTSIVFMSARNRYGCAESLIGSGFGGTVIGSIARSLFIDGLRWRWIAEAPDDRRRSLLGDLLEERNRLVGVTVNESVSCSTLPRWLMPLPDVADLTGASHSWIDAPAAPNESELLQELLSRPVASVAPPTPPVDATGSGLLDMAGLRGVADVLAFAGHGNFLGLQGSLTEDGAPGFDLRADHEALYMHAAAVGVVLTLLGTSVTLGAWPEEVDKEPFLVAAVALATEVANAATVLHGLAAPRRVAAQPARARGRVHESAVLLPGVVVDPADFVPERIPARGLSAVATAAEDFYTLARSMPINPWAYGNPTLHEALAYGGGHSNLETVMVTYDQPGAAVMGVFAARMLMEEAARLTWRFAVGGDEDAFKERAKQFFDEFRYRRRKAVDTLNNGGVPRSVAHRLFEPPDNVVLVSSPDDIARGRTPIPSITSMLRDMAAVYPEPGWLVVAYSMLSQTVHSTPVGLLHTVRFDGETWLGNELSPEMRALALDAACLGSAVLIGHSTVILTDVSPAAKNLFVALRRAAARVHGAARMVHGLG